MTKRPSFTTGSPPTPAVELVSEAVDADGGDDRAVIRTLRCRTVAQGRFHQLSYVRDLPPQPVMDDVTEDLAGETTGPNPLEALLAAFGSCLVVGIHANAVARHIPVRHLEVHLEADVNTTAVWGTGDVDPKPIGFEIVRVSVQLDADAPSDALSALVRHAALWSPVANTLHNPVHLDVMLAPPPDISARALAADREAKR